MKVLIDVNASQGNIPVTINVTSNTYPDIEIGFQSIVKVLPDRLPDVFAPEITPDALLVQRDFPVTIANVGQATDVFSISVEEKYIPTGWSIDLSLNQSTNVLVRVDKPAQVWLSATVDSKQNLT